MTETKESRTERLLRVLNVGDDFKDPRLPSGLFSHSQYNSWLFCGEAYRLKYVEKQQTPDYVSTTNGSAVHSGIEATLTAKMNGVTLPLEEGHEVVRQVVKEKAERIENWGEDMDAQKLEQKAIRLYNVFYMQALPRLNPVALEQGFAKRLGDVPVIGFIDMIDEVPALASPGMAPEDVALAPKQRVVVDHKTGSAKWSQKEVDDDTQMTLYAHVMGLQDVRVDQYLDQKKGAIYHRGDGIRGSAQIEIFVDHINQVAEFVRQGVFPKAQIGSWCCNAEHCSYWKQCRGKFS